MGTGEIGESLLSSWADKSGMVPNKPENDKFGWDKIIEYTLSNGNDIIEDNNFQKLKCFIQVKTTKDLNVKVRITLNNWDNMIKNPLPFFIIYILLDNNNNEKSVYLSHIDEFWMKKILKKLRMNNGKKLNSTKIEYKPRADELILDFTPEKLRTVLSEYIGDNLNEYCKTKISILENIGYEKYRSEINFSVKRKIEDVIDFSIGLKNDIEVENVKIKDDIRFNIPSSIIEFENGRLAHSKINGIPINLCIEDGNYALTLEAKLFLPLIIDKIQIDKFKFRISFDCGDIIIDGKGKFDFNYNISLSSVEPIVGKLIDVCRVILIFSNKESNKKIYFFNDDLEYKFPIDNSMAQKLYFDIDKEQIEFAKVIDNLYFILKFFNLSLDKKINLDYCLHIKNIFFEMRTILDIRFNNLIRISLPMNDELKDFDIPFGDIASIPRILTFRYDKKIILISGYYSGRIIKTDSLSYLCHVVVSNSFDRFEVLEEITKEELTAIHDEIVERTKDRYFIIDFYNEKEQ